MHFATVFTKKKEGYFGPLKRIVAGVCDLEVSKQGGLGPL